MRRRKLRLIGVVAVFSVLFGSHPVHGQDVRAAVEQLAAQLSKGAPENREMRVAVADFPDLQGVTSELGRFVAGRLTTRLAQSPKFFVVERQRLSQVLAELKFSMSDLVDPAKVKQLGKMAGVDAIVVGSISDFGNQVDVDARMIDIETNRMFLGTSVTIGKDPSVVAMMERGRQETIAPQPTPTPSDGPKNPPGLAVGKFRFSSEAVSFDLDRVEIAGEEIKFLFVYTNRRQNDSHGGVSAARELNENYIVDNRGTRYGYTGDSLGGQYRLFAPQVPERLWVSFKKPEPGGSTVTLRMNWNNERVLIRNIPMGR
jgi:TolB-like protein